MVGEFELYLFGDQTFEIQPQIKDLLKHRDNPLLADFLVRAYGVVRAEIYKLPQQLRDQLPRFSCSDDLILWDGEGQGCVPLDMALTCIYQLGLFIVHTGSLNLDATRSRCLGLCTGALAAAVVSCSRNAQDLVPLAVDAVLVAFRIGIRVTDVASRVTASYTSSQSWSIIVPKSSSAQAVDRFCDHNEASEPALLLIVSAFQTLPFNSRPYVSAYAPNGVTVSGPPASLAKLVASDDFKGITHKSIPIHGPYHAPHLFSQRDVEDILSGLPAVGTAQKSEQISLFSSTGVRAQNRQFAALLEAAVRQILVEPIRWNSVIQSLTESIGDASPRSFRVIPFGTNSDQLIYTALKQTPLCTLLPPTQTRVEIERPIPSRVTDGNPNKPKLAIIGMSGRFPGAKDNEAFWDLLHQGLDVHKPVPPLHWNAATHVDLTGSRKNTSATPFGCWLDDPEDFDARFFNISPREAPQIDPAQRLALMTAYEAIEQAGLVPDATPSTRRDRVGVFYGVTSNDWMETNSAQNIDTYFIPGGNRAFIPGRINYFFKFSGPSYAVDTACSSSLAGIHLACNSLWRGDVDTAIAGGTNVLTNPDFTAGLDRGHFLSRTGNCKTFDDGADGYCRGEGIGTVIIKRLDDAIAERDPILGIILGAYTNHSAESESITRPHVGAQRAIFRKILNQGAVDPYTVSYVEMHGTGTQAGDAGEMSSVLDTFAPPLSQVKRARTKDEALYLGSAKANIGHGEAASGVSSLIKVLLMMQKNLIPPHCGIKNKINHKFPTDLQERNVNIALCPISWERGQNSLQPRRAFVNNFSAAGGNSALLLEDGPLNDGTDSAIIDERDLHLVACSAKNGASLQGNLRSLLGFLKEGTALSIGQLSYTTTARRIHHQHRVMLLGSSSEALCSQINAALQESLGMTRPKSAPKVVFAFTGQGAQYAGMGKQLFESFSLFRREILHLDQMAIGMGFPSFLPVIESGEKEIGAFAPTEVQLAGVCLQIALGKLWMSWGITPGVVVGHSLGEYAALNVAGVLSDVDAIYLVGKRAQLLESKCTRDTHAMLVVKGSVEAIKEALGDREHEIACINSPVETVLAGPNEDIAALKGSLTAAGFKTTLLKVPYAFHSSQVDPILPEFLEVAGRVTYRQPRIAILCPLDGSVISDTDGQFGPSYLASHSRQPVNMRRALLMAQEKTLIGEQTVFLELGPHPAVTGMVKGTLGPQVASLASLQRGRSAWQTVGTALQSLYNAGADIRWGEYQRDFVGSHKVINNLPAYSWDLKKYWMQYVHDWSLRKGDAPLISNGPKLESTTIHRVVKETSDAQRTHLVVEADITRKDLSPLVQGHEVDGIPLCTPSVYTDIALSLGNYVLQRYRPDQDETLIDVTQMDIFKALILREDALQQLLQAHADFEWSTRSAVIKFMSFDSKQQLQEHSRCILKYRDRSLQRELQGQAPVIQGKIQRLREGIASGITARFNRPMVYRAIRPLARFHDDYRAIDEIVLNSKTLEASSRLSFGSVKRGGDFHTNPAIIDSLTQSCGFTMNCNDGSDLDVEVFMNHGWGSFQMFEPMDFEKEYTTYTRMEEGPDKLWRGDVVIFDGDRVVAFFGQIAIQGVPRRVLGVILSIESGRKSQKRQSPPKSSPATGTSTIRLDDSKLQSPTSDTQQRPGSIASKALTIVAEESGLSVADLTDSTVFSDVGIDSLLGLTISARFKEELDLDIDFNAFFFEYPTVADLRALLTGSSSSTTGLTTPESIDADRVPTPASASASTGAMTPGSGSSMASKVDFDRAVQIISEESGVSVEDLTDDTNFADAGIDSLLSLVIVSRFRDELELDIQHESLFLECPTLADLKRLLLGDAGVELASETMGEPASEGTVAGSPAHKAAPRRSATDLAALVARKEAVDECVRKYSQGFFGPLSLPPLPDSKANEKVVLVTGGTGSLGGHLVYHVAQLPGIKYVVCLNREHKTEPMARQIKAMREKGIRFPESLKPKLVVVQTDSSKPKLGLPDSDYERLAASVTHIIHNAWPMSAKRPFSGFEPQFQTMRNLIDLARDAASRRAGNSRVSFQMVSSVGVVGQYGLGLEDERILVPEERVDIDTVLPNGYGDAKWGCERMLDETLHKFPERFRTMACRLGQIAGSKTSGYWNPMEHFGFLIKSSQTLNALPDVDGTVFWTPVNDVARALSDLVLSDRDPYPIYHIENPVGQPWKEVNAVLADALKIPNMIPFEEWVDRVRKAPHRNNPASTLVDFLDSNYLRMSCGGLVLDVKKALEHSESLATVGPVSEEVTRKYIHIWREIGFLE